MALSAWSPVSTSSLPRFVPYVSFCGSYHHTRIAYDAPARFTLVSETACVAIARTMHSRKRHSFYAEHYNLQEIARGEPRWLRGMPEYQPVSSYRRIASAPPAVAHSLPSATTGQVWPATRSRLRGNATLTIPNTQRSADWRVLLKVHTARNSTSLSTGYHTEQDPGVISISLLVMPLHSGLTQWPTWSCRRRRKLIQRAESTYVP